MMNLDIITGQFVRIDKPLANVGARLIALLIDLFIIFLYLIVLIPLIARVTYDMTSTAKTVFFFLFDILPVTFYFVLAEFFSNGMTVGKTVMGIRVVTKEGAPPSLIQAFIRFIFLTFELSTGFGLVVLLYSKYNQRLGDMAAGTYVIKYRNSLAINTKSFLRSRYPSDYVVNYPQAENLSQRQVDLIEDVKKMSYDLNSEKIKEMLCGKICETLKINLVGVAPNKFLSDIINDYYFLMSV